MIAAPNAWVAFLVGCQIGACAGLFLAGLLAAAGKDRRGR